MIGTLKKQKKTCRTKTSADLDSTLNGRKIQAALTKTLRPTIGKTMGEIGEVDLEIEAGGKQKINGIVSPLLTKSAAPPHTAKMKILT